MLGDVRKHISESRNQATGFLAVQLGALVWSYVTRWRAGLSCDCFQ